MGYDVIYQYKYISWPLCEADIWLIAVSRQVSGTLIFGYPVVS